MTATDNLRDTYEIQAQLGSGAGGIVYKAYHKRLQQSVVLKQLRNNTIPTQYQRKEVDILKNLHHSYLPQVLDLLTTEDGTVYTVMSYIPGKSFQQLLKEGYTFSQQQLVRWAMQLCSALNYLHGQTPPIIHADIKPANIMLTPEGNVCLIDFNISFYLDDKTVLGYTAGYASPEQYIITQSKRSQRPIPPGMKLDQTSDIYSLGATLYHLATGQRLRSYDQKPDLPLLVQCTGEAFARIILKSISICPADRFSSALDLFHVLQNIPRQDMRYRPLLLRQRMLRIAWTSLLCGALILSGYGMHLFHLGQIEQYNFLTSHQEALVNSRKVDEADVYYLEAIRLLPGALESYYQKARGLYLQQEYQQCISYIDYDILQNEALDLLQSRTADVYYLKAESHFALEQYDLAVQAYEELFRHGGYHMEYYRDYAIALANAGNTTQAEVMLSRAVEHGLDEDFMFYITGEIEYALDHLQQADDAFAQCIIRTENDHLKARAYVMRSQCLEGLGQQEDNRSILLEAVQGLPSQERMLIYERLIQADIDLGNDTGMEQYRQEAITYLHQVISLGWASYNTYDNLAILYTQTGALDKAGEVLSEMAEKFDPDYNLYKRYAFLELERQALLPNGERNYTNFAAYYKQAAALYETQRQGNETDTEMELLKSNYLTVQQGGWLS